MTRIGVYGTLCKQGSGYGTGSPCFALDVADWFVNSKMDWFWAQLPWPAGTPYGVDVLAANGRRVILRTFFWGYTAGLTGADWTTMYNNPSLYGEAVSVMAGQINNFGAENLYGITISEEEPALACNFDHGNLVMEHFIYGYNVLYDSLKTLYPELVIMGNPHPLGWFTDAEFNSVKQDALIAVTYPEYVADLQSYLGRAVSLAATHPAGPLEVFTLIYAAVSNSTSQYYEPPDDPTKIRPMFEAARDLGIPNIGFFCSRLWAEAREEMIIFNDYVDDPTLEPWQDPYDHKVEIMSLIQEYAEEYVEPPLGRQWLMPAIVALLLLGIVVLGRRKR